MSYERRKIRVGTVISDKMDKTVVVSVEWRQPHRLYKKAMKRRSRYKAHDETNNCTLGDVVRIVESRPLSKTKRWRVFEVLSTREIAEIQPEDIAADEVAARTAEFGDSPQPDEQMVAESPGQDVVDQEAAEVVVVQDVEPIADEVESATPAEVMEPPVSEAEPIAEADDGSAETDDDADVATAEVVEPTTTEAEPIAETDDDADVATAEVVEPSTTEAEPIAETDDDADVATEDVSESNVSDDTPDESSTSSVEDTGEETDQPVAEADHVESAPEVEDSSDEQDDGEDVSDTSKNEQPREEGTNQS